MPIVYPDSGEAAVAETTYVTGRGRNRRSYRLVVRRSRLTNPAQQALWPDWRYHAFVTSSVADTVTADRFHRDHAVVELAIRDLKDGAGLEHCPSGRFFANAAWLACAVLAHNLFRRARPPGQPRRHPPLARPPPLALGRRLHPGTHQPACPATRAHLDRQRRPGAPQTNAQRRQPHEHEPPPQRAPPRPPSPDRNDSPPHPPAPADLQSPSVDRG